jgi:RHS repeat-associated protein
MYDEKGKVTWETELDIYGRVRKFTGSSLSDCPFRYQGQYHDAETGLAYNRFRYYSPDEGIYISKDPIGLKGNNPTMYGYVKDVNSWVDVLGLLVLAGRASGPSPARNPQDIIPDSNGVVKSQAGLDNPLGKSSFDTPENMANVLKDTNVHEIKSTNLPEGLDIKADGVDVGGTRAKGHHTIFPTMDMTFDEFNFKLSQIETEKIGKIDKKGNYKACH